MFFLPFSRLNRSRLANWWWTVDKVTLSLTLALAFIGLFLVFSASPSVARTIGAPDYHFIIKQLFFFFGALTIVFAFSILNLKWLRRMAILGYISSICLIILVFFCGIEIKGATRWISIFGFQLQPSEFVKPTLIVVTAWLLDGSQKFEDFPGRILASFLIAATCGLIYLQKDLGMTLVIASIGIFQIFLTGLSWYAIMILGTGLLLLVVCAYFTLDHVYARVHMFLASDGSLSYQVQKSLDAFANGNLFGRGPGEGVVKHHLPDAHTDFIFAVAGEEFGVFLCLLIVIIYMSIVVRSLFLSLKENNLFIMYAASGLAASLGLQSIINMASTLNIGPTKGMALPFISYGGSTMLSSALTIGMLLALTRRNSSAIDKDM